MTMEDKPVVEVARDLGISPERIYKWRRDEKLRIGAVAFASAGGKALMPEGELPGQCADGKLLRDIEDGMRSQKGIPDA